VATQAGTVFVLTKPYESESMPGVRSLQNLLQRNRAAGTEPGQASSSASSSSKDVSEQGAAASPDRKAYDEVVGGMFAGSGHQEDPPAALMRGGEYSGWVYTAPLSKYDRTQVRISYFWLR